MVSYADDTQLAVTLSGDSDLEAPRFCDGLREVANWMKSNCLQLNTKKTEIMVVGKQVVLWDDKWWTSELGVTPLPAAEIKNLGVWFDSSLSFICHTKKVAASCYGIIRGLRPILKFFDAPTRQLVVQASVLSRLDYANSLLAGINQSEFRRLQRVQNAAARLVTGLPRRCSVSNTLRSLHWLPVQQRIRFKVLCFAFKILKGTSPQIMEKLPIPYVPSRTLRSLGQNLAVVPRFKLSRIGGRSFRVLAACWWNSLPPQIRAIDELLQFRRAIKTFLFV